MKLFVLLSLLSSWVAAVKPSLRDDWLTSLSDAAVQESRKPQVRILSIKPARTEARNGEPVKVEFALEVPEGWHVYPVNQPIFGTPTVFELGSNAEVRGTIQEPTPKRHKEEGLEFDYHEGSVVFVVPVALKGTSPGPVEVKGTLVYQICDPNVCVDSSTPFSMTLTSLGGEDAAATTDAEYASRGFLGLILLGMLGGLISLVMPCTYPMIPITVTYFVKQAAGSRSHGMALSTAYSLGIILAFTGLGFVLTLLLGAGGPREFAANPWVNLVVGALFLWFTGSLFGWYEIRLPFGLGERLALGGTRHGMGGAFILGLLFAVVTFTCTIPIAATILGVAAGQHRWAALFAMFAYSVTMAVPFFAMGLFPGLIREIPKAGGWMSTFKSSMAWLELALALMYFSKADQTWQIGALTRPVVLAVWVAACAIITVYVTGFFRRFSIGRVVTALFFLGLGGFMARGFAGASLGELAILVPPPAIHGTTMPQAMEEAAEAGKPLFVEFTGLT
ncbi:MAG: hypothetical protein HYY16_06730 [Planctomycetes bacterium]|nr:hypothetical protein [Planctomycetota bacterium]